MIGDDLTPFFVPGEFAGNDDTLNGAPVVGIFDGDYVVNGPGLGMSDTRPVYTMASAAVPLDAIGMQLIVAAGNFKVVDVQPDGTGITLLILECS